MKLNATYYTADQHRELNRIQSEVYNRIASLPFDTQRKWAKDTLESALRQGIVSRGSTTGRVVVVRALIQQAVIELEGGDSRIRNLSCATPEAILARAVGAAYGHYLTGLEQKELDSIHRELISARKLLDAAQDHYIERRVAETHE